MGIVRDSPSTAEQERRYSGECQSADASVDTELERQAGASTGNYHDDGAGRRGVRSGDDAGKSSSHGLPNDSGQIGDAGSFCCRSQQVIPVWRVDVVSAERARGFHCFVDLSACRTAFLRLDRALTVIILDPA